MIENKTKGDLMQEYILVKAEKVFMQNGYHGASMDLIAETCQISKPTLYRYYKSKYELFMKGYMQVYNQLLAKIFDLIATADTKSKAIDRIIDFIFDFGIEKGDYFRMMMREHYLVAHQDVDKHIEWYTKSVSEVIDQLMEFIKDWVRPEISDQVGLDEIAAILFNVFSSIFVDIVMQKKINRDHWKIVMHLMLRQGLMKEA